MGGERLEGEPFFSRRSETVERTTVITEGSGKGRGGWGGEGVGGVRDRRKIK